MRRHVSGGTTRGGRGTSGAVTDGLGIQVPDRMGNGCCSNFIKVWGRVEVKMIYHEPRESQLDIRH